MIVLLILPVSLVLFRFRVCVYVCVCVCVCVLCTVVGNDVTSHPGNVTSLVDATLTLQCPLAATTAKHNRSARTSWQRRTNDDGNWRLLPQDGRRRRVRHIDGALEFYRLLVSDTGFYRCSETTSRGVNAQSAPVVIIVHGTRERMFVHYYGSGPP